MNHPVIIFMGIVVLVVFAYYLILSLAFGIPYMIGIAKLKLSCMTNKRKQDHGQEEK